jgi:CubicO group peptidase (beta-lactamase class C family)
MNIKSLLPLLLVVSLHVTAQDKIAQWNTLFDSLSARQNFSGCILIAENGRPVFEKAIGYADMDKRIPNKISTRFELASVSKQFTAMAIMQLKEQGKLRYEDSLRQYFPALRFPGVTIRHLLTHTSGIPEVLGWNEQQLNTSNINYNADIMRRLPEIYDSTQFTPGTDFKYSNTNYLLLAQIVEKVSGEKFADYMRQHIFLPAGMKNTLVYSRRSNKKMIPDYALGYAWDPGTNRFQDPDSTRSNYFSYYLDGLSGPFGISSNVEDLLLWDQALYTEKLVRQTTLQEAFTPYPLKKVNPESDAPDYGFGWMLNNDSTKGHNTWHSGGWQGYNTLIVRYTDHHRTIIILSNTDDLYSVMGVIAPVDDIFWNMPYVIPEKKLLPHSIALPQATLDLLRGTYQSEETPAVKMYITVEGNKLFARFNMQTAAPIYPESADTFFYTIIDARVKFERDTTGKPTKLTIYLNGQEMVLNRRTE